MLQLHPRSIYRRIYLRQIPFIKLERVLKGTIRILRGEFEEWLEERTFEEKPILERRKNLFRFSYDI